MFKILTIKKFYLIIFIISIISLLSAVYIENVLNENPCILCLYQRIPYLVAIFICFLGYNYQKNFFWLYLLILTFLISAILAGYHVGIENNIIEEFSGCKNVDFKLFGLSLATINLIISLIISLISIKMLKNEKKK